MRSELSVVGTLVSVALLVPFAAMAQTPKERADAARAGYASCLQNQMARPENGPFTQARVKLLEEYCICVANKMAGRMTHEDISELERNKGLATERLIANAEAIGNECKTELGLSSPATLTPDPFEEYSAAYDRGDLAGALRILRRLADQSNARAQYNVGVHYEKGLGTVQNDAEAVKWYRLSAAQGYPSAQLNLGTMLASGRGVPQNDVEALKWWRLAADQGDAVAQFNLGQMYTNGRGVTRSDVEAVKWYQRAADGGYASAQYNLGRRYALGQGVPQNYVIGYKWFNVAAAQGIQEAVKFRDIIAQHMTPAQVAEAQNLARDWKAKPER